MQPHFKAFVWREYGGADHPAFQRAAGNTLGPGQAHHAKCRNRSFDACRIRARMIQSGNSKPDWCLSLFWGRSLLLSYKHCLRNRCQLDLYIAMPLIFGSWLMLIGRGVFHGRIDSCGDSGTLHKRKNSTRVVPAFQGVFRDNNLDAYIP